MDGADGVVEVAISELRPADCSPRFKAIDEGYARALADVADELPPILVRTPSMQIVDGAQRARAAQIRGQVTIRARLFEGDDLAAFVAAVEANTNHGLRLTRAERTAASVRILDSSPEWSDRAIAQVCGLSDKTVAGLRSCATAETPQLHKRVGRDGRTRPVDNSGGRRIAEQLLEQHPGASLRWVAGIAGIAPNTVKRVRSRMHATAGVVLLKPVQGDRAEQSTMHARAGFEWDRRRALMLLTREPTLYMRDSGKAFLRWLSACVNLPAGYENVLDNIPAHCTETVLHLARDCSQWWALLAEELDRPQDPDLDCVMDVHESAY